jgi:L-ribulose-5-phosphate 3-epimerase UlaE
MAAIIRPMTTAMDTAAIALAIPISKPRTLAVRTMARRFMAGPEKRKAVAGPIPAPFFSIPANMGSIVQLQTASIVPDVAATP